MAEKKQLEYFLLRYVADAIKQISVPIGIVMHEPGMQDGFMDVRFTNDWRVVQCVDPEADVDTLAALGREIGAQLTQLKNPEVLARWLTDSSSNLVQVSEVKGVLAENPKLEIGSMASMYLEPRKVLRRETSRKASSREVIVNTIREEWKRVGIESLIRENIEVAKYTGAGDPFTIDFGYKIGNQIKLFHAVSLKKNVESAERLTYRFPKIVKGMEQDNLVPTMAAVIDKDVDLARNDVQFAVGDMERNSIHVVAVTRMPEIAENAKRELVVA
jgi:hypothetical protein